MLPDRVSNPGPLTYESGALPIALRGPALIRKESQSLYHNLQVSIVVWVIHVPRNAQITYAPPPPPPHTHTHTHKKKKRFPRYEASLLSYHAWVCKIKLSDSYFTDQWNSSKITFSMSDNQFITSSLSRQEINHYNSVIFPVYCWPTNLFLYHIIATIKNRICPDFSLSVPIIRSSGNQVPTILEI